MVERDLTRHPPPEEAQGVRPPGLEHQGRGETVAPAPTPLQRQGQTARPDPAPEVADRLAAPTAESLSLERRAIETQLPEVAAVWTVPPLPMASVEPPARQTRSLDTRVPEISPTMTPAVPLGFPAPLPRPALQPTLLSQALPQVTPYTFAPTALPLPRPLPVPLAPSRFTQALAFPVVTLGPSIRPVPLPATEQEDVEDEGGEGNGAGVGLLEWLFERVAGRVPSHLLSTGRSRVVLAESAEEDSYANFLLYLLAQVYRCDSGTPRVQWTAPITESMERSLVGGKVTFIAKPPGEIRDLLPRLKELMSSDSWVLLSVDPGEGEPLVTSLAPELPGVDLYALRLVRSQAAHLLSALRAAFAYLGTTRTTLDVATANLDAELYSHLASYQHRVPASLIRGSPLAGDGPGPGRESDEHLWTKCYLAWLHRGEVVEMEQVIQGARITDVYIGTQTPLYYEVETLYGTGSTPIIKLNQTLVKYLAGEQVRIVVPNFIALLHLRELLRFEGDWHGQGYGVTLWTLDFSNESARGEAGLRRLSTVAAELRRVTAS